MERDRRNEGRWLRLGALAGIAAPLLMWIAFFLAGVKRNGYNLLLDPASELGQAGIPGAWAFNLGFFVIPGVLIMTFAARLNGLLARRRFGPIVSLLIGVSGLSLLLSGLITMNPGSPPSSLWHQTVGLPLLTTLPAGILLASMALPQQPGWQFYRGLCLAIGLLLVALIAGYELHVFGLRDGILQRANLLLLTGWYVAMGIRLIRLPGDAHVGARHGDSGYAPRPGRGTRRSAVPSLRA